MSHRKGSFQEDWNDLLTRFAHKGTRAALADQLAEAKDGANEQPSASDIHQMLFERAQR